jgi:formylglycine-generating enzyme required for sulfatase activity
MTETNKHLSDYINQLCLIPDGTFVMGTDFGRTNERPSRAVTLSKFLMGATPVTVAMWSEYCKATGVERPEAPPWGWNDDHPIVNVSWDEVMGGDGFCRWASSITGYPLTLPTEAQFEYASLGGNDERFPWGHGFDDTKTWSSAVTVRSSPAPVVRTNNIFRNAYGLTDLVGNVWQWCSDWYGPYLRFQKFNPHGTHYPSIARRSVRGSNFCESRVSRLVSTSRNSWPPIQTCNTLGFRVVAPIT